MWQLGYTFSIISASKVLRDCLIGKGGLELALHDLTFNHTGDTDDVGCSRRHQS